MTDPDYILVFLLGVLAATFAGTLAGFGLGGVGSGAWYVLTILLALSLYGLLHKALENTIYQEVNT